jgi:hypothetical protein
LGVLQLAPCLLLFSISKAFIFFLTLNIQIKMISSVQASTTQISNSFPEGKEFELLTLRNPDVFSLENRKEARDALIKARNSKKSNIPRKPGDPSTKLPNLNSSKEEVFSRLSKMGLRPAAAFL